MTGLGVPVAVQFNIKVSPIFNNTFDGLGGEIT
jgi:hypothetical protein